MGDYPTLEIDSSVLKFPFSMAIEFRSRESVFLNLSYLWVFKCKFQTLTVTFHFKNNETVLLFHLGKTMTPAW